jgi:uncharacterized cupin superfamily protein
MKKVNLRDIPEDVWVSPKGKFASVDQEISVALGRNAQSTDLNLRHPFDVEICRVPPGKAMCPFHSHSAQWEFYHIMEGIGQVRDETGITEVGAGDAFIFKPGEAHQISNPGDRDLVLFIVADNPIGESCYYPDSTKWSVPFPKRQLIRGDALDYLDREE